MSGQSGQSACGDVVVGIDLGTTNSLVAVAAWPKVTDMPRCLAFGGVGPMVPSVVRFGVDGQVVVGAGARSGESGGTGGAGGFVVSSVKRLMGRSVGEVGSESWGKGLAVKVVGGENGAVRLRLGDGREVSPQEVSAYVLGEIRRVASGALGVDVRRAVITVPAYFDDAQRQATRDAARLAGLEAVRLVAEPTAAALAYGLGIRVKGEVRGEGVVAVYDLGGGTFDCSILRMTPGELGEQSNEKGDEQEADAFSVLATAGDTRIGGDDFDLALGAYVCGLGGLQIEELTSGDVQRLVRACEGAKIELTEKMEGVIDCAGMDERRLAKLGWVSVSREVFEGLIGGLVDRTLEIARRAVVDAGRLLDGQEIERVILVGGATRVPMVRRRVEEFFKRVPYTAIDPDQAIAIGAAVQGAIVSGRSRDSVLFDVVPLSLGIETAGGGVAKIIMRNSVIPANGKEMFSTQADNQTGIMLHVLQGEREMAGDCRSLGTFHLRGIPAMPAGLAQLEVSFHVDVNAILTVSAHERRSGKRLSVQIVPSHGLTKGEVERLERESFVHAKTDMARHRIADLIVNSKLDVGWIRNSLARVGRGTGGLDEHVRADVLEKIAKLEGMIVKAEEDWQSVQADAFLRAKEELDRASVRVQEVSIARSLLDDQNAEANMEVDNRGGEKR